MSVQMAIANRAIMTGLTELLRGIVLLKHELPWTERAAVEHIESNLEELLEQYAIRSSERG